MIISEKELRIGDKSEIFCVWNIFEQQCS